MKRSHSRHSYPDDKHLPLTIAQRVVGFTEAKSAEKDMHKTKSRQRARTLERQNHIDKENP